MSGNPKSMRKPPMINADQPVHPVPADFECSGLTKREEFAKEMTAALIIRNCPVDSGTSSTYGEVVTAGISLADELLRQLETTRYIP